MSIDVGEIARRLTKARVERRPIEPITDRDRGFDLAAGYAVQRLLCDDAGPQVGWKLGVTSRAKQQQVNVGEPIRGFLAEEHVLDIGEPLVVGRHIQPRCEPEIAFVLGRDLQGMSVTASQVLAATRGVAVAIEVLDSRFVDYRFAMPDVVADNTSAARFVMGSLMPADGIDLRLVGVLLEHNGEVVSTAAGAAALSHPAAAVAWLVRSLAADGDALRAGEIVLSGGLTAAVPVQAGDVVVATVDRIGVLELACR